MSGLYPYMYKFGVVLCCCIATSLAIAGPAGRAPQHGAPAFRANRLDLTFPAHDFGTYAGLRMPESPDVGAAFKHLWKNRVSVMRSASSGNDEEEFSSISSRSLTGAGARPMSRIESYVRQVHREGLPLARLWENQSALVSLGLNPRGKPGLWLLQKTR